MSTASIHLPGPVCNNKRHMTGVGLEMLILTCSLSSGTLSQWLNACESFVLTCFPEKREKNKSSSVTLLSSLTAVDTVQCSIIKKTKRPEKRKNMYTFYTDF